MPLPPHNVSSLFIELGLTMIGLSLLARVAARWGFSVIPLYLLAGLAFGNGGLAPLQLSQSFIATGAEIGVVLLLFMLGLEYSGAELKTNLRRALPAGIADFVLNFTPGFIAGLLLHWQPLACVLLGGVTYVSSSGIIAKMLSELRWMGNPETPLVLSILVIEDLGMAVYLPLLGVLLASGRASRMALSVAIAVAAVIMVLIVALRYGRQLSKLVAHESDEIILLTTFGVMLLVAGTAQTLQVSSAIGAFLVGIAVSGPIAEQSHRLIAPLRDLFAAMFFFFFGLQVDPSTLPPVLPLAFLLGLVTAVTKVGVGYWAARQAKIDQPGRLRAGIALIARGEFSIVIAGLGAAFEPRLGGLSAAYVVFLAILGPMLARLVK